MKTTCRSVKLIYFEIYPNQENEKKIIAFMINKNGYLKLQWLDVINDLNKFLYKVNTRGLFLTDSIQF